MLQPQFKPPFDKALVTGGAGFIGSHLVEALVAAGCRINVVDDLSTGHMQNLDTVKDRITFIKGDIRDPNLMAQAASGCQAVFHLAAVVSVPQTVRLPLESAGINETGALAVFEAARRAKAGHIVFASSCAVYGDTPSPAKRETDPPCPASPYAVQKLSAEYHARLYHTLYGINSVCLRFFNVYGPRQDPASDYSGVISIFLKQAAAEKPATIYGDGSQSRDFVFVKDVVRACLAAASTPEAGGKVFNVGTGRSLCISELWHHVCDLAGRELAPLHADPRKGDVRASLANTDIARGALGFSAQIEFKKGLRLTYDGYGKI